MFYEGEGNYLRSNQTIFVKITLWSGNLINFLIAITLQSHRHYAPMTVEETGARLVSTTSGPQPPALIATLANTSIAIFGFKKKSCHQLSLKDKKMKI